MNDKKKLSLTDFLIVLGLLSLFCGVYLEYGLGKALIVCGSLVLAFGYKNMPIRKG